MDKPDIVRAWCAQRVGCPNQEGWKIIEKFPGYCVSNTGKVMNNKTAKILSPWRSKNGYMVVRLRDSKNHNLYVHRLVAEAFCVKPNGCDVVNHLDNDTTNNAASNLCWGTQRDNVIYAMEQGRVQKFPNAIQVIGEKNGVVLRFRSYNEAAQFSGCDSKTIWSFAHDNRASKDGTVWRVAIANG